MVSMFISSCQLEAEREVDAQDVLDAISTISPKKKLCADFLYPGQGPDFFLNWANEELGEAATANNDEIRLRKYYNATVYARGSVECLIDWYLSNRLLNFTISPMAGAAQKLEALDAENLLGINFSLFNDIVFEPRNRGVHKFELVEEKEAKHAYELAMLTIRNCVHRVSPAVAPIFYGELMTYSGIEQVAEKMPERTFGNVEHVFYFEGIGKVGDHGVLIDRTHQEGRIAVWDNIGDGKYCSRFSRIRNRFTSSQIRDIFALLEDQRPKTLQYSEGDLRCVLDVLLPERPDRYMRKSAKPTARKRKRGETS
jgi:hypothetical protein